MLRKLCTNSLALHQNQRTFSVWTKQLIIGQSELIRSSANTALVSASNRIQSLHYSTKRKNKVVDSVLDSLDEVAIDTRAVEFQEIFQCTYAEAVKVSQFLKTLSEDGVGNVNLHAINRTVNWLHRSGATLPIIMKNCHLLLIPIDQLKKRFERLSRSTWKQVDDFLPLLGVQESKIKNIQLYQGHVIRNRIYFLNELFGIEPHIISHYCSKHLFIFDMELELLKQKLDMLMSSGVSPSRILYDLNVVARSKEVIEKRLEFIKKVGIERIIPWMIKCDDKTLTRAIENRNQRNSEQNRTLELLADRLNWHWNTGNSMFVKYKFLQQLNHDTTLQLLDELSRILSPEDITANIGLLSHSVAHVKIRVDELIALNNVSVSPKVLQMSDRNFKQYLNEVKNKVNS